MTPGEGFPRDSLLISMEFPIGYHQRIHRSSYGLRTSFTNFSEVLHYAFAELMGLFQIGSLVEVVEGSLGFLSEFHEISKRLP